ncbi:unnamed protein product [Acanthoscelides obtectus]|uniref:Uncharacterized protein n=1 Tax=Acanthoscelides obtectus TaxID=200917 RepID=A0A9P0KEG4_ACAOB|nr:unnamed protein product [Acanthoscelides obtectus]CAK1633464.1 hypothetical protein AOBTE_LOCUS8157 [Acanthoscelides obtectus]
MVDIAKKNKTENSNINDDVATTTDDNKKIIILKNDVIQKPHCGLVIEQVVNNQDQDEYQSIDQQPMELVRDFVSEEVVSNQDQDQYQSIDQQTMKIEPHCSSVNQQVVTDQDQGKLQYIDQQNMEIDVGDNKSDITDPFATDSDNSYRTESDNETSESERETQKRKKKSRKRVRNELGWQVSKRKVERANGQEYKTKKNKIVQAKILKEPCRCKKKCYEKFSHEERISIFKDFYSLTYNEQTQILSSSVREFKKRRCTKLEEDSRRSFSHTYLLNKGGLPIEVCKVMFMNTLDVSFKRVRYTIEKCRLSISGICGPDQRGKHGNHHKISDEDKSFVIQHISKFPAYKSHYSRLHSEKRYLSPDLSIQQMYRLYIEYCKEAEKTPVSDHYYRSIFVSNFNLSFHPPHNDTCSKCDKLNILIKSSADEGQKIDYEREKKEHLDAAEKAYNAKRIDKEKSKQHETIVTAMFDLQKCLPTPHLKSGIAFYKRQLWVFNLTIYEVTKSNGNRSFCFMWDETTSNRGGQEIASCLLKYIRNLPPEATCLNLPPNHMLKEVHHKFLISGHTHLEADSIHASIEKAKKHTTMDIEIPRDWSTLVRSIQRKGGIKVIDMSQDDFYNISALQKAYFVNRKKNADGEQMSFLKANYFLYTKENPGKIFYKEGLLAKEDFKVWDITKKKKGQPDETQLVLERLHNSYPLPLPKKKLDDINTLIQYIHPNCRLFYANLKSEETAADEDVCPTAILQYDE